MSSPRTRTGSTGFWSRSRAARRCGRTARAVIRCVVLAPRPNPGGYSEPFPPGKGSPRFTPESQSASCRTALESTPAMNRRSISCSSPEPLRFPTLSRMSLAILASVVASGGWSARAAFAGGDCVVNGLANGVSAFVTSDPATFQVNAPESRWAAVAMRNHDGSDWNLEVRSESQPHPVCTSNSIAVSNDVGPDVFAIDGRVGSPGSDYVIASTGNASGFFAIIEYEQPAAAM